VIKRPGGMRRRLTMFATAGGSIADLARGLHMATTAEGVETPEQFEALRADGVTAAQGYLFSRPLPAGDLRALLTQRQPFAVEAA